VVEDSPIGVGEREWERGLWWMVLASGGMHVLLIALLLLIPQSFAHHPQNLVSYTVDLVAPDKVGGTNLVPGGKGRIEAAPPVAAPPAPKVEAPKPEPPKVAEAKPPQAKPEPQKAPPPEKPAPKEIASKAEPPKVEEKPRVEPKPKEDEAAVALKVKKVEAAPTAVKAAPSPAVKRAPSPKVVAKAEPAKSKANPESAKKAAAEAAARERDERILAAVKRVEQQAGAHGGGTGQKKGEPPGGPISVGPGQGAGGTVIGLEYQLYYNALINRLKQSWAWAGADRSLEAVVRFSITETGDVVDVRITHPSGDPTYDLSVERAVKAVNPLPPPPDAYRKEFSDVEITFSPENLQM
jgi:TolA protein